MRGIEQRTQQRVKRPKDGYEGEERAIILCIRFLDERFGLHGIEKVDSREGSLLGRADERFARVSRHGVAKALVDGIHLQEIGVMRIWNE